MIVIEVTPMPETAFAGAMDHRVSANVGGVKYAARSRVPQSALRNVINQLAEHCDDQPVLVAWPTVELRHRSLWDLAGIRNREEQQQVDPSCIVCAGPITGRAITCSARCRKRASRARQMERAA